MKKIDRHARKHRDLLGNERERTDLTEAQARVIIKRIDGIREQLPEAIRQAHERIIGERLVPNEEKILSLYEPDIHVLVRGKAGAEVEFGNTLLLAEQRQGVIVDWRLIKEQAAADSKMVAESLDRFEQVFGSPPEAMAGDRGFDSDKNREYLKSQDIFNGVCPRNLSLLLERLEENEFREAQNRRSQTEARISILSNCFCGSPMKQKGFDNRYIHMGLSILSHNLWVLARLKIAQEEVQQEAA